MDIIAAYKTDTAAELTGRYFPFGKDAQLLVARSGNPAYVAELTAKLDENKVALDAGGPRAEELANEIFADVMSKSILLGWTGITRNGTSVSYSQAQAKEYLKLKEFRAKVSAIADNFENFLVKEEAAQGNG